MEEQQINKKVTFSIVAVLLILLVTIGATYAYFSVQKSTDAQTVTTGTLTMGFTNGNIVKADDIIPISDSEIKPKAAALPFTITNTGSEHMKLTIELTNITIADDLKDVDFRWGLYNADTEVGLSFGIFKGSTTGGKEVLLRDVVLDKGSATKNYVLRVWIHDDGGEQNEMQGESFSAKVTVTGQAVDYTPESCFTFNAGAITNYDATCGSNVVIPKTIGGVAVTTISGEQNGPAPTGVFQNKNLNSVVIPEGVTKISMSAFNSSGLKNIVIPEGVTTIGDSDVSWEYTFGSLTLDFIAIPETVTALVNDVFSYTDISSVVIPGTVSALNTTFQNAKIENIILMEGVTTIGQSAFYGNTSLTSIEIPSSVTTVSADITSPASPFKDNTNLTEIVVRNSTKPSGFDANWNCKTFGTGNTPSRYQCTETYNTIYRQ